MRRYDRFQAKGYKNNLKTALNMSKIGANFEFNQKKYYQVLFRESI